MHTLIVVAHPLKDSATQSIAKYVARGIKDASSQHTFEIADLAEEGFDPRFTRQDIELHKKIGPIPEDVLAEHSRLDKADALVLIYPIYWWSFPALLKGWIDRVFSRGWAFDENSDGKLTKMLRHMHVHLIAIGGAEQRTFARHGYFGAMKTQIDKGIFEFCGARVETSELFLITDPGFPNSHFEYAHAIGQMLFVNKD